MRKAKRLKKLRRMCDVRTTEATVYTNPVVARKKVVKRNIDGSVTIDKIINMHTARCQGNRGKYKAMKRMEVR